MSYTYQMAVPCRCGDPRHKIRWETSSICKSPCHGAWCASVHPSPPDTSPYWWFGYRYERSQYSHDHCWWWTPLRMELYTLACKRCSQWCACPKECHLAQHGPWCSHDIHSRKASIEPSRHFNTSDLSSEATAKLSLINGTLTEEIEVVNAIYGPGTLTVLIADSTRLRLRLELPLGELQATVFWLNFAADYPQTRPSIQQAELTLQQETDRRIQNVFLVLFSLLSSIRERSPCIESLIHESLPIIASLRGHAFDPETATDVAPYADPGK